MPGRISVDLKPATMLRHYAGLALGVGFCVAALCPCACAEESPDPAAPIVLKLSGLSGGNAIPGKEPKNIAEKASRAIIDDFLKKHPDVRFAAETGLKIPGPAAESGVLMSMAGGSAGDILYVNFRSIDQFVNEQFLSPLDDYILAWVREVRNLPPDAPLALEDVRPEEIDVHPAIWKVVCRRGPGGRRHVYALPFLSLVMALNYRKDLFRDAGLDPNKPPKNWEELFECCEKLTDPVQGKYGLGTDGGSWHFINFLWQGGSEVVLEDENGDWRAVFNDDRAVETLRFIRKLFTHKKSAVDPATGRTVSCEIARRSPGNTYGVEFNDGKCAMVFEYTNELMLASRDLPPTVLGMAALPAGPGGRRANEINAPMWGINAQVKDPRRKDAAWAFLRHQASLDARRLKTRVYVQGGYANMVNPEWLKKFGYDEYLDEINPEWREANLEAFKWGKPEPYGKNCKMIYLELQQPLDIVLSDPHAVEKSAYLPGTPEYEEDGRWIRSLLDKSVVKTNAKLLGVIPPEQLQRHRVLAWGAVLAIALVFLLAARQFFRTFQEKPGAAPVSNVVGSSTWRHHARAWIFLAAAVLSIGVWSYYPLFQGAGMAFQDYHVMKESAWVGLDNFIEAFNREDFWIALRVTIVYVALSLGVGFVVPIVLALMLHEVPRGKVVFRVLFYLPAIVTGLITMFLWKTFYDPTPAGMLNQFVAPLGGGFSKVLLLGVGVFSLLLLTAVVHNIWESVRKRPPPLSLSLAAGIALTALAALWGHAWIGSMWLKQPPYKWLEDADLSMLCVIVPSIWAGAGPGCLMYLAALKAIPEDIYEAADLDGASPLQKVWHVVLPNLKPLIIINFVGAFIGAFHAMGNIFVMTGSGPLKSTHVLGLEIWMSAFLYLKYGYATAVAWILGAMLIGFTIWQLRILREMKFTTAK